MRSLSNKLRSANRGQAILLIALAMVGLVAFVGLMIDVGIVFIEQGKLRRGIDAGAIAAAQQFRKGFQGADLAAAANNFLLLNDSAAANIVIYRCGGDPASVPTGTVLLNDVTGLPDGTIQDTDLCTEPRRKFIRVEANRFVNFGFLRVVGIQGTDISASAVGEAASIDLVLVIDTSASMAYDTYTGPCATSSVNNHCNGVLINEEDPSVCNYSTTNPCQPLKGVKDVAKDFLDTMFFPYDRVAVVAMTSQTPGGTRAVTPVLELTDDQTIVENAIDDLKVFEPVNCNTNPISGPCILYGDVDHDDNDATAPVFGFAGLDCPVLRATNDPSTCNSSNIGGALFGAGLRFIEPAVGVQRDEALWIVIMLAGGPANATDSVPGKPDGFCPRNTWLDQPAPPDDDNPFCRDTLASTRHVYNPLSPDPDYDADDYARDAADFIADPVDGNGITVFTIGLGNLVRNATRGDADAGEQLLDYIAEHAGDPAAINNHGFYKFAPTTAELDEIFAEIASSIFTRITQ